MVSIVKRKNAKNLVLQGRRVQQSRLDPTAFSSTAGHKKDPFVFSCRNEYFGFDRCDVGQQHFHFNFDVVQQHKFSSVGNFDTLLAIFQNKYKLTSSQCLFFPKRKVRSKSLDYTLAIGACYHVRYMATVIL